MTFYRGLHLDFSDSGGEEAACDLALHLSLALLALRLLAPAAIDGARKASLAPCRPVHQGVVHKGLQQCQQGLSATPHDVQNLFSEAS